MAFIRAQKRKTKSGILTYYYLVEKKWENGKVKQNGGYVLQTEKAQKTKRKDIQKLFYGHRLTQINADGN